jgi:hypothetical protein
MNTLHRNDQELTESKIDFMKNIQENLDSVKEFPGGSTRFVDGSADLSLNPPNLGMLVNLPGLCVVSRILNNQFYNCRRPRALHHQVGFCLDQTVLLLDRLVYILVCHKNLNHNSEMNLCYDDHSHGVCLYINEIILHDFFKQLYNEVEGKMANDTVSSDSMWI